MCVCVVVGGVQVDEGVGVAPHLRVVTGDGGAIIVTTLRRSRQRCRDVLDIETRRSAGLSIGMRWIDVLDIETRWSDVLSGMRWSGVLSIGMRRSDVLSIGINAPFLHQLPACLGSDCEQFLGRKLRWHDHSRWNFGRSFVLQISRCLGLHNFCCFCTCYAHIPLTVRRSAQG